MFAELVDDTTNSDGSSMYSGRQASLCAIAYWHYLAQVSVPKE